MYDNYSFSKNYRIFILLLISGFSYEFNHLMSRNIFAPTLFGRFAKLSSRILDLNFLAGMAQIAAYKVQLIFMDCNLTKKSIFSLGY
jgi:cytochrome b subunit of formate dehydrogenase